MFSALSHIYYYLIISIRTLNMHFVSSQSQTEQMSDIVNFLLENIHESVDPAKITPAFTDFDAKIKKLDE